MNISKPVLLAALAAFVLCLSPAALPGQGARATSIAVLVNDDPITEYDVQQRTKLIRLTGGGKGTREQAVDELIEERLKQQAAKRLGVTANETEVDQAFGNIAQRVKLAPSQLAQALQQQGISPDTLKRRLRADLAWRDVVRSQMRRQVNIRDTDIQAEVSKRGEEAKATSYRYTLQPVVFVVPKGSSQAYARQRMQEAARYSSQFNGCESARELTGPYRDTVVQEKVRRSSTELPGPMREKLEKVAVGRATSPEEIENGVQVLGVCTRDEVQDTAAAQEEIRSELLNEEGQRLSRRLLIDLKQAAVIEHH